MCKTYLACFLNLSAKGKKKRESLSESREIREKQERIKRRKKKQEEVEKDLSRATHLLAPFEFLQVFLGDKVSVTNFLAQVWC